MRHHVIVTNAYVIPRSDQIRSELLSSTRTRMVALTHAFLRMHTKSIVTPELRDNDGLVVRA